MTSYTKPRIGAISLGLLFAGITARVLLDDVAAGQPITLSHIMSVGALIATIAAGHFFWIELKAMRIAALGLGLIFIAGTAYVVVTSTMRNAETQQAKNAGIRNLNLQRQAMSRELVQAEADLEAAKSALELAKGQAAVECGSGKGKKCDGRITTRDDAERARDRADSHVALIRAKIALLGPERTENGGYQHFAKLWAVFVGGPEARAVEVLVLVMPALVTLIVELTTVVFFGMGFVHEIRPAPASRRSVPAPDLPPPTRDELTERERMVNEYVRAYTSRHGHPPRTRDVVSACNLPKASASRYRARALAR